MNVLTGAIIIIVPRYDLSLFWNPLNVEETNSDETTKITNNNNLLFRIFTLRTSTKRRT